MTVTITIVSYNTKDLLAKCLKQILAANSKNKLEVIVVDNASSDASADMLEKDFKWVKLLRSKENGGFAKGQNQALRVMTGEYALLLNPDTDIPEKAIDGMVDFMEKHPNCGIASCQIVDYDGHLQSNGGDLPTGISLLSWLFNLEFLGQLPNFHRQEKEYFTTEHKVGWVGGTLMVIRKEVIKKVGLLNEDYFMYFEDAEYCYKAQKAGFDVMINPSVTIKHKGGASSKDPRFNQWLGEMKGLLIFYRSNFSFFTYFLVKKLVYLSILLRILAFGLLGRKEVVRIYGKILFKI